MQAHVFDGSAEQPASTVVTDMLETIRVSSVSYDLRLISEPWRFERSRNLVCFYVVRRGRVRLELEGDERSESLSVGDVCLLPHGHSHAL